MTHHEIYAIAKSLGLRVVPNTGLRRAGAPPVPVELEAGGVTVATYSPLSGVLQIRTASMNAVASSEADILNLLAQGAVAATAWPKLPDEGKAALFATIDRCLGRIPRLPVDPL